MAARRQWLLGGLAITMWYVWAFIRLLPPASVAHGIILNHYRTWAFGHLAYSDIFALYGNHSLFNHGLPYIVTPIEYPVLMGVIMWLAAWATTAVGFYAVTATLLWISALAAYWGFVQWRPQKAWAFALTPLLLTYGLLNWDVMGIALMVSAAWLYHQKKFDASAVMFAAAVFFKFFPLFYLPFIIVDLWRQGERRRLYRMTAIFGVVSAIINVPFALLNFNNWFLFFGYNAGRSVSADVWNNALIHLNSVPAVDLISLALVVITLIATVRIVWRGGSMYQAAALLFSMFLFVNKVFSPQYMLWLMAYGIIAEWPWDSLAILSGVGLIDYVNSMTILHLFRDPAEQQAANWYAGTVFPLGILARYLGLAAGAALAMVKTAQKDASPHIGASRTETEASLSTEF